MSGQDLTSGTADVGGVTSTILQHLSFSRLQCMNSKITWILWKKNVYKENLKRKRHCFIKKFYFSSSTMWTDYCKGQSALLTLVVFIIVVTSRFISSTYYKKSFSSEVFCSKFIYKSRTFLISLFWVASVSKYSANLKHLFPWSSLFGFDWSLSPFSPDINLLDYFLCGSIKGHI
jgi:uncharacterized membrane protein